MHNFAPVVWKMPSAQRLLQKTGQNLKAGISMIIMFPRTADLPGFLQLIRHHIERDLDLSAEVIDTGAINGRKPLELLREIFPDLRNYQYLEQVVIDESLPDVLFLSHLDNCSQDQKENWIKDISRWAEACRSTGSQHSLALLVNAETIAGFSLPTPDVRLTYQVWAGIPTVLEARLIYRADSTDWDAEDLWREYLLSSLAGSDLLLGEYLWDRVLNSMDEILLTLRQYAVNFGWSRESLEQKLSNWRPPPLGSNLDPNPHRSSFELLGHSILTFTPENGEEIHSAALAILDKDHEVIHRIWRAQTALIMPVIDDIRLRISNLMENKHGPNWAADIDPQNPLYPDLGKIKHFFNGLPNSTSEKSEWKGAVTWAWKARNELAHYRTIEFQQFQTLWSAYVEIRKYLNHID